MYQKKFPLARSILPIDGLVRVLSGLHEEFSVVFGV